METVEPKIVVTEDQINKYVKHPDSFGKEIQIKVAKTVSSVEDKIVKFAKNESTKPIVDSLHQLKEKLDELNPKKYENVPWWKKFLRLVPTGDKLVRYIAERFESVSDYVDHIMKSLEDAKDQIIRDNIDLEKIRDELKAYNKELEQWIETGKALLDELQVKRQATQDPVELKKLENAIFMISRKIQDLQTLLQSNLQFLISIEQTLQNNKALLDSIDRTATITRTVLTVGLAIRSALVNQKQAIEMVKSTQDYTAELLKSNAEAIKQQTGDIEQLYTSPVLALDKLKEAYDTLVTAINDFDEVRKKAIDSSISAIKVLDEMNRNLKQHIKGES